MRVMDKKAEPGRTSRALRAIADSNTDSSKIDITADIQDAIHNFVPPVQALFPKMSPRTAPILVSEPEWMRIDDVAREGYIKPV